MTTRARALRSLAVYAAGFLPFALFWRSIGFALSILIGVIATLVVALTFPGQDAKSRAARTLHQSTEQGK